MDKVNVLEKFKLISDYWNPRVAGELNGQQVKLVKFSGEFIWHKHELEDELFFVVKGEMLMHFREKTEHVGPGEFIVVPHGVEHKPEGKDEVWVMLFEPAATLNTGNVTNELTRNTLEKI